MRTANSKLHILFIVPSLHTGGSERVMLHLMKNFDREKFRLTLVLLDKQGEFVRLIPEDIK